MIIMEVKISMGEEEVMVIIIKEFIMGICALELNLFRLVTRVSHHRVCRRELKLIVTYLTTL